MKKDQILILVIILFHIVGLVGFAIPVTQELFIHLVPFHLLLMLVCVMASHRLPDAAFFAFTLLVVIAGFVVEYIGVHTGLLFGNYRYGETLGLKFFNVPLLIGVNWFLLIYSTAATLKRSFIKNHRLRIVVGALVMVLLDVLIEPVAIKFDYWNWEDNLIPIKNYICWFGVSAVLLWGCAKFRFKRQGPVGPVFLLVQFIFFLLMRFV